MKANWVRKNVAKVHIKGEGAVKKGVLDVKVEDRKIYFKKGSFLLFEGTFEKAHLLFKVFPSEVFVYDDMPYERNKSVEVKGSYAVFFDKYQALAVYFSKSVKMYIDGVEMNHHVSTPAVDFYISYANTPLEAVKSLRSVIRVPSDTIGTYLDLRSINREKSEEYISSFEGCGVYLKKKDERLINFANNAGKKIAGTFSGSSIKIRRSWNIEKHCDRFGLVERVLLSSLQKRLYASCELSSPVYLTDKLSIPVKRKILESSMKNSYSKKFPPVFPIFFLHNDDKKTWYIMDYFYVGGSILYVPPIYGRKFDQIYIPEGNYMELSSKEIVGEGINFLEADSLLLKEGKAVWYKTSQNEWNIIAFKGKGDVHLKIEDRVITIKDKKIKASEGEGAIHLGFLIRTKNSIREVSMSVNKTSKEVSI